MVMSKKDVYASGNQITPNTPIVFDEDACIACDMCIDPCMSDVFISNPERGKPSIVLYPDECWYCGVCLRVCPVLDKGAISLHRPMMQRVRWKNKETGEHFRIGMPSAASHRCNGGIVTDLADRRLTGASFSDTYNPFFMVLGCPDC